jgi:outer membrane protein OmpA-like peptidoglycan-associated protein
VPCVLALKNAKKFVISRQKFTTFDFIYKKERKPVSDSKHPKPLPDDFGETTPNIKVPKSDSSGYKEQPSSSDWEKTNYNYSPKDLGQQDDWNKTSYNTPKPPKSSPPADFNQNYPQPPRGKQDDWGMTEANINIPFNQSNPHENQGEDDFGQRQQHHGKTTPFIYLPENEKEKVKFQDHKPAKTKVEEQKEEAQKKGGIPGWIWTVGGLFAMFLFAVTVILAVYLLFMGRTGFEVILKGAKPNTDVLVDSSFWGVTSSDGTIRLPVLRAGKRTLTFINPNFKCDPITVTGADGDPPHEESMRCGAGAPPPPPTIGYEVLIVNAPPKSEVWVDNKNAGMTDDKGTAKVQVEEGPRKIEVKNPGLKCKIQDITGIKGDKKELSASCRPPEIPDICFNLKKGQYDLAADCAFKELARLEKLDKEGTPYTVDQVLLAMNLYIINFDSGKYVIKKPRDFEFIKRASEFLLKLPGSTVVEVGGHTDNKGKDAANKLLSENRAKAVKAELVKLGIKEGTLPIKGYGPTRPIEDNKTEDGRWRNRRIEYTLVTK